MKYLVLVFSIFIASCASILDSSTDFINISTNDGSTVKANVTSKAGMQTVYLPTVITVPKSCRDITVEVIGDGNVQSSSYDVSYHANPWVYASILLTGVIGVAVDGLTGKACTYDSNVIVPVTNTSTNISQEKVIEAEKQVIDQKS